MSSIQQQGAKVQMRFNQEHAGSGLNWRLIIDGEEHLVKTIVIRTPVQTEVFFKEDILKGNIFTHGKVSICDGHATVDPVSET